jgi:dipeptidyl-peptidase-4
VLDNRSASNKGAASAWGIHRNLGAGELQDQLDGLEWLRAKGWADMDRIALNGWSYGGYFTSYAMTHSKAWKIGFVGAPVTDWHLYDSIYTERYMGLPSENKEGYERSSVIKAASALSGKVMIMHGTMDDNVHPQNMVMLIDALIKRQRVQFAVVSRYGARTARCMGNLVAAESKMEVFERKSVSQKTETGNRERQGTMCPFLLLQR